MSKKSETLNPSLIAVRCENYDAILDIFQSYYSEKGLELVEERIGSRSGKYATSPKQYSDLAAYTAQERETRPENQEFTTDFDLYGNRKGSTDWKIFFYYPYWADLTLNIDKKLAQKISESLNTNVIEYYSHYKPEGDKIVVRGWKNGELVDELSVDQGKILRMTGYFFFHLQKDYEVDVILAVVFNYGDSNSLDLEYADFNDDAEIQRPMYLKGKPDLIKNYLSSIKNEI